MNRQLTKTEKLVDALIDDGQLELVDATGRPGLIADLAKALALEGVGEHTGQWLGRFFEVHPQVAEVFVEDDALDQALARWHGPRKSPQVVTVDRDPAIEAQLAATPIPDPELAAVYADWLIEHGNPLGELFACAGDPKARKRVLTTHAEALWGPVAEYAKLLDITWDGTGAAAIRVEHPTPFGLEWGRVIALALDRPCTAFCRALSIGPLPHLADDQFDELLAIIGARPRPMLQVLEVTAAQARVSVELSTLATGFPRLTVFELIAGGSRATPLHHPTLEALSLRLFSINALERTLVDVELPRLRKLTLAAEHPHTVGKPLGNLIAQPWFAQLEELDVSGLLEGKRANERLVEAYGDRVAHLRLGR